MEDDIQVEDGATYSSETTRSYNQDHKMYVIFF
jgi:hypothetical protein